MNEEERHVYYDAELGVEAYNIKGHVKKFPAHFHEYYVIGFIEHGRRRLRCMERQAELAPGDIVLFAPHDSHFCEPIDAEPLDYRAVNVPADTMARAAREAGINADLRFTSCILHNENALAEAISSLYTAIVEGRPLLEREGLFFSLTDQLFSEYAAPSAPQTQEKAQTPAVSRVCAYIEEHYTENISTGELMGIAGCGRTYLFHIFTRETGVAPYRYLQTVRLERAKKMLETGLSPADAAAAAGFSDQSHFTNTFRTFIGLTPKQYQRIFAGAEPEEELL